MRSTTFAEVSGDAATGDSARASLRRRRAATTFDSHARNLILVLRRTPVASHRLDQFPPARATRANRFGRRAWRAARAVARRCRLLPVALRLVIVVTLVPVRFTVVARELVDGGGRRRLQLRLRVVHDVGIFCFVVMQR